MTKQELRAFIEQKRAEKLTPYTEKINQQREESLQAAYESTGYNELETAFKARLNEAYRVLDGIMQITRTESRAFHGDPRYELNKLITRSLREAFPIRLEDSLNTKAACVLRSELDSEYAKVLNVIDSLPNGRACEKFLRELGFELPDEKKASTALSVNINTEVLGLRKND